MSSLPGDSLLPFISSVNYNDSIKDVIEFAGITYLVTELDTVTRKETINSKFFNFVYLQFLIFHFWVDRTASFQKGYLVGHLNCILTNIGLSEDGSTEAMSSRIFLSVSLRDGNVSIFSIVLRFKGLISDTSTSSEI